MSAVAPPTASSEVASPPRSRFRGLSGLGFLGYLSFAIIVIAVIVAIFGPMLAPHPPNEQFGLSNQFLGPSGSHPLGLDVNAKDILSRTLVGARTSLIGPLVVVIDRDRTRSHRGHRIGLEGWSL